ncbi:hypothetical protein PAXRUDRAFT_832794 [Paxillus rubicundulus Ve08.2h10]|uniref:Unplaced genomic scaffold scaffold_963, whole genome shotgun sequence n=1 Tax=Paxillus rubicundulus Ve08.2h10 TaxID=930991 RepID=A0A0D0CFN7_9AGAM|nr:hypothetical protein PAXRUDRAFT_832794 [Paxillus rubicundulus Ve08.2h10]
MVSISEHSVATDKSAGRSYNHETICSEKLEDSELSNNDEPDETVQISESEDGTHGKITHELPPAKTPGWLRLAHLLSAYAIQPCLHQRYEHPDRSCVRLTVGKVASITDCRKHPDGGRPGIRSKHRRGHRRSGCGS